MDVAFRRGDPTFVPSIAREQLTRAFEADPAGYTAELVAAAVCAGAKCVFVSAGPHEASIAWYGDGPGLDELQYWESHLFGEPRDAHGHMMEHLAVGLFGARLVKPAFLHIDRGTPAPSRYDVLTGETVPLDHGIVGTRITVGRRSAGAVAKELLALDQPETLRIRDRCEWCPIPIVHGDQRFRPRPANFLATWSGDRGSLWLGRDEPLALVRHGVTVHELDRRVGRLAVSGWFEADHLALDTRRTPIPDAVWHRTLAAIDDGIEGLLHEFAGRDVRAHRRDLVAAAVWLADRGRPLGPIGALPLVLDATRRWRTFDEIRGFTGLKGTIPPAAEDLVEDGQPRAVLADRQLLAAAADAIVLSSTDRDILDVVCPGLPDVTERLFARAVGNVRKRRIGRGAEPASFPDGTNQRTFVQGQLRGAVTFGEGPDVLTVRLQVRGLVVQEVTLPSPAGPMRAILDHPWFATDDAFTTVLPDVTRGFAEMTLWDEAIRFAASHVHRRALGSRVGPTGEAVLAAALRAYGGDAAAVPAMLREAPAYHEGGRWLSLAALPPAPPPP